MKMFRITHYYIFLLSVLLLPFPANADTEGTDSNTNPEFTAQEIYRVTRLARNAESDGDLEKALNLWVAVINVQIDNSSAYRGIQRALIGLAQYEQAITFLDSMYNYSLRGRSNLKPISIAADRIDILFLANKNERADEEITKLLDDYKGHDKAYTEIASVLFQHRKSKRATQVILQGRKDTNDKYLYARNLARWHESHMNWHDAIEEYLLYLEDKDYRLNYVTGAIGDMPAKSGADSIAVEIITNRIETTEGDFGVQLRQLLASLHFKQKRYSEALQQYKKLDRSGKKPGYELLKFADLLMTEKEFELAHSAYQELLSINFPKKMNAEAALGVGRTDLKLGKIDSARAAFNSIIAPGNPNEAVFEAFEELGRLELSERESPAKAREMFESALKIAAKSRINRSQIDKVRVASATTWAMEGDLKTAKKELIALLKRHRRKSDAVSLALYELTRIAFWQGDTEELAQRANALITADPSSTFTNDALSFTTMLTDLKDDSSAIQSFGRANFAEFQGFMGKSETILGQLSLNKNPLIVEEACWRLYRLEMKQDSLDSALVYLEQIINLEGALKADLAVYTAGELIEKRMTNPNLAMEYYEKILIDYPDSPLVEKARRRIREMESDAS